MLPSEGLLTRTITNKNWFHVHKKNKMLSEDNDGRRDHATRHAAPVGTDRQEDTAKRVMDTGCALCEAGGGPHQRPGICSMSY
jgi:hypothetical protein